MGVALRRASVGGDIEVVNVSVDGGSGVIAEDVSADGPLRIGGVSARGAQEPPHGGAGAVASELASAPSFTSTQRNVNAGRDIITIGLAGANIRRTISGSVWAIKRNGLKAVDSDDCHNAMS
ncbi:hypothetical protein [Mycolicibacterium goodii]|uniref:hypothetical protein n=1 Tax=Mycolicibacterium goodii TaxID=134601 RepID=UPI001BDD4005|nr:hypothetical protein [Mycolicibacterium goodii]MBU8829263.1 hypothetical protein [Mycolicibacterium goodii]